MDPMAAELCPFCAIAAAFPPGAVEPVKELFPPAHVILSTPHVLAFLDIQPLTRGHLLVCPREHRERLTDMAPELSARLGAWLPVLAKAVVDVVAVSDFNIVQNNGIHAAQAVPHVHYHIIPRPSSEQREKVLGESAGRWLLSRYGDGVRSDLDDGEGAEVAARIRGEVERVLGEVGEGEGVEMLGVKAVL